RLSVSRDNGFDDLVHNALSEHVMAEVWAGNFRPMRWASARIGACGKAGQVDEQQQQQQQQQQQAAGVVQVDEQQQQQQQQAAGVLQWMSSSSSSNRLQ
ncbi:hypothetical protein QJQ45_016466, partial [Haematococcus lacustris]